VPGACDGVVKQTIPCKYCTKRFRYQTDLDEHMHSHIKEKFQCAHCKMNFARKNKLQQHIEEVHVGPGGPKASSSNGGGATLNIDELGL